MPKFKVRKHANLSHVVSRVSSLYLVVHTKNIYKTLYVNYIPNKTARDSTRHYLPVRHYLNSTSALTINFVNFIFALIPATFNALFISGIVCNARVISHYFIAVNIARLALLNALIKGKHIGSEEAFIPALFAVCNTNRWRVTMLSR